MKKILLMSTMLSLFVLPSTITQLQADSVESTHVEMARIHRLLFTLLLNPEGEWPDSEIKSIETRTEHAIQALLLKNGFELVQYVDDLGTAPMLDVEIDLIRSKQCPNPVVLFVNLKVRELATLARLPEMGVSTRAVTMELGSPELLLIEDSNDLIDTILDDATDKVESFIHVVKVATTPKPEQGGNH